AHRIPPTRSPGILTGVKGVGVVLAVVLAAVACASGSKAALEQRTTQGPLAEELWVYRVAEANGREPTFEERTHWERQLDLAITRYLAKDQEYANSLGVLTFRSARQAAVGMSKEQVVILLGAPQRTTTDAGEIEKLAGKYWPDVQPHATEAWVYPMGWRFYFDGIRLVDITQYQPR
ncbi:MAG TPA: hypothetical protein VK548_20075, partial [Candidatus Acidoferrum sp.]|nr:hypothetical protein [Candidatus Acidoferrum sp.]